jgi:signal transduction histidine kinase/PAS domain-containing protein
MARRCRAFDWAATPLGPADRWPVSLRTTVATLLTARHPMILFWGPERVQLYNDAYIPALGVGRHPEVLGRRAVESWAGEIWEIVGPQIEAVIATGEATWHEDQYVPLPRHGRVEETYWTYTYAPAYDDAGCVAGVLVITLETTRRVFAERESRAAQAALAAERAQLGEIVDRAPAFMAVLRGPEHRFARTNAEYDRLVGGRARAGLVVREALPEVAGQGFVTLLDRVLATGEPFLGREVPVLLERTPGNGPEQRHVDFVYQALVEADGTRSGIFVHGVDVTDSVRARHEIERLLGESRAARADAERAGARAELLQSLTAALARAHTRDEVESVVVTEMLAALGARTGALAVGGADGESVELARQVGFPATVAQDVPVQPLGLQSPLTECFRSHTPIWIERRDGPEGLDVRYPPIAPVWDAIGVASAAFIPLLVGGAAVGAISFAFAGSRTFEPAERAFLLALGQQTALAMERARLFAAEHAARQDAEAANRAKSDFLATMSHELRTPLNAIGGYAELIELGVHGPVTAEQRTALDRIQRAQRHLLGLINGVLNYARAEAGAVHYELADVPLGAVLATCEVLVTPQARAKGLTLAPADCAEALSVYADAEKLRQVLLNLLTNAVKFTEPGGRIAVACETSRHATGREVVAIRVSDTGVGIAADQLGRVFEPFVQVDARLTRTQEGTGLGLAISRDLARGMGGDLTVVSTLGVGSTFTLTLPRV